MREISHSGSTAGYRTWLARYPDAHATVAVLCNAGSGANAVALGTTSTFALLGRQVKPPVTQAGATMTPPTAAELERYVGLYCGPNLEQLARFMVRDGQLFAVLPSNRAVLPSGPDRFRAGASELIFRMLNGRVKDLLQVNGVDSTVFLPLATATPTRKELASYAGSYWSDELDTRLTFVVRDTVLVVKRRPADEIVLRPTFSEGFIAPGIGSLVFSRDKAGNITGFGIWAGRVRDVRFVKER